MFLASGSILARPLLGICPRLGMAAVASLVIALLVH